MKRIGQWHLTRLHAAYRRTGSVGAAAAAAHVSLPTAYRHLTEHVVARVFTARMRSEARRLYVEGGMSCRRVARELRCLHEGEGPSQETIHQWMKAEGVLRNKTRANEIQNARRAGRYVGEADSLRDRARRLVQGRNLPVRRVAAMLGVSRNFVIRSCGGVVPTPAGAQKLLKWWADLPDVARRRRMRDRVVAMRLDRATYSQIAKATGVSIATVSVYLRQAGLTFSERRTTA